MLHARSAPLGRRRRRELCFYWPLVVGRVPLDVPVVLLIDFNESREGKSLVFPLINSAVNLVLLIVAT